MSTQVRESEILAALRSVRDPDRHRDIVALEAVGDLRVDPNGSVRFTIALATAEPKVAAQVRAQAERAVMQLDGVAEVHVEVTGVPAAPAATAIPGLPPKRSIPGARHVIAVSSGKGGVGKSTICVNLACALSQTGARVGVLDGDVYGPSIPMMLGLDGQPEGNDEMIFPMVRHGLQVISMGLLVPDDQPMIWRGPMLNKAVQQFMFQVDWRDLDYLFVDLPPGTGDVQLTLTQNTEITGALIVTTPQDVAVLDVKKAVRMFEKVGAPCLGIVENMSWFQPPGSTERYELFGSGGGRQIEAEFGIPLLGQIPIGLAVREGGDSGTPITIAEPDGEIATALRETATRLVEQVENLTARKGR